MISTSILYPRQQLYVIRAANDYFSGTLNDAQNAHDEGPLSHIFDSGVFCLCFREQLTVQ
jgi:hypothetical protein